jgi:amidohydrolase
MPARSDVIARLDATIDRHRDLLSDLAAKIHAHPELRFEEHKAAAWIAETLEKTTGLTVERGVGGLPTALRARVGSARPRVAVLAEYDALPEIGHACGHNLIAAGAVGAFVALAANANDLGGSVDFLGTPAEEGGGGKITLIEAGLFEGVDAAMMYHPFDRDVLAHTALANVWIQFEFTGKPSHAAIAPFDGSSALTACLQTFHLIDTQRVHFRDGVRVHGFVTNGGQAVNIIPERAACEFSVRALNVTELARVRGIVERCAQGAAMAAGVEVKINARRGYRDMQNNLPLAHRFGEHMRRLGRTPRDTDPRVGAGSTDMGDVSHTVPSIHPWIAICDEGATTCHQHAFALSAASERGMESMSIAAKSMAAAAADFLADGELRAAVKSEFETLTAS